MGGTQIVSLKATCDMFENTGENNLSLRGSLGQVPATPKYVTTEIIILNSKKHKDENTAVK